MKRLNLLSRLALGLALTVGAATVGCKKSPKGVTPIPENDPALTGAPAGPIEPDLDDAGTLPAGQGTQDRTIGSIDELEPEPVAQPESAQFYAGMVMDRNALAARTVYFEFDRSVLQSSEIPKATAVADLLAERRETKVLIEGHCDERGTEEYNYALGQRRADAIREYLITYGIAADRVMSESKGEEQPADPSHNESAWAANRRGEFILLLPQ